MSVKIEILDYKFSTTEGTQMITNPSFTSSSGWSLGAGWTISGGKATHAAGVYGYLRQDPASLVTAFVQGQTYRIKYKISGRTAGSLILANHLANNQNGFHQSQNGAFTYDWVQGASDKLSLYGSTNFDGSVEYAEVYPIFGIDWENSVVGELDVTDHNDFPLAMTFQISDIKDITSTSGDYSKTFKVPATKNNNKLFKYPFSTLIDKEVDVNKNMRCRILINNLFSLSGFIKVTGVGAYGETPSYYNCVFYGNNMGWADKVSDLYMTEIDWGTTGVGLTYNRTSISNTWADENCESSTSPIVYPVTSYGRWNPDGLERTLQLLNTKSGHTGSGGAAYYGFDNAGSDYGTPPPVADWRPAVFVKTTLEKIFENIGYTISSTFMNTDMFKKLVWLLPNFKYNDPDTRLYEYSYANSFTGQGKITTVEAPSDGSQSYTRTQVVVDLNDAGSDFVLNVERQNTGWDAGSGVFTVQEYGYYGINLNNIGVYWDDNTTAPPSIFFCLFTRLEVQLQTVGQTSWNVIGYSETPPFGTPMNGNAQYGSYTYEEISINRFLNTGDKLRIVFKTDVRNNGGSAQTIDFHIFGASTPLTNTTSQNANGSYSIEIAPIEVAYGQTYDLSEVIYSKYKQIDFIKGVSHAFNLKMTTDDELKVVNIEPFSTFYKPYADAIDWTQKLDRNIESSDAWIKSNIKRTLVFKYKTDSNDKNVEYRANEYWNGVKDEYPYQETLSDDFMKGESKFENPFFAGTYNGQDQTARGSVHSTWLDVPYSGCLWTEPTSAKWWARPEKGNDFLPRLLYWKKYSEDVPVISGSSPPYPSYWEKSARVQSWAAYEDMVTSSKQASGLASPPFSNVYPQATSINRDDSSSPILSYGDVWVRNFTDSTATYSDYVLSKGLFGEYYSAMFRMLMANPRIRTVYIDLKVTDIVSLDFGKLIYIDGVYWRINKIVDYQPNKNQSTKVELTEWIDEGIFAAEPTRFNSFGNSGTSYNWGVTPDGIAAADANTDPQDQ